MDNKKFITQLMEMPVPYSTTKNLSGLILGGFALI
jgi:hypothetical protein